MTLTGVRINTYQYEAVKSQVFELFCATKPGLWQIHVYARADSIVTNTGTAVLTQNVPSYFSTPGIIRSIRLLDVIGFRTKRPQKKVSWPIMTRRKSSGRSFLGFLVFYETLVLHINGNLNQGIELKVFSLP